MISVVEFRVILLHTSISMTINHSNEFYYEAESALYH
jgi:hypothetical protein